MMILKGLRVGEFQELVGDAMEPVLKPLVYEDPVRLVREHHERGEPVYIVSATLQKIVDELARELGFDGALGSICEIVDGMYTGRVVRPCHGAGEGPRCAGARRARGHRSRPLDRLFRRPYRPAVLEVVGKPVAVNPDRKLRPIAEERGWPIQQFSELAYPSVRRLKPALLGIPLALGAGAAVWAAMRREA